MADVHSVQIRSKNMQAIRTSGTFIERRLITMLEQLAVTYRAQVATLPGKPDFVVDDYQAVIFVHGCFWHHHHCHLFKIPATRTDFWLNKIQKNVERDWRDTKKISALGWRILIIWECALRGQQKLPGQHCQERIEEWLCAGIHHAEIDTQGIHQKNI